MAIGIPKEGKKRKNKNTVNSKICSTCKIKYPISFYHKDSRSPDGHKPKCKKCKKIESRERWESYGEKITKRILERAPIKKCRLCEKNFKQYQSIIQYCSKKCSYDHSKEKRKGENNPAYKHGLRCEGKDDRDWSKQFIKNRKKIKEEIINDVGYIYCQNCNSSNSLRWETHHIIYRSQKPKHEHLHNERNLIVCCIQCHNEFHKHCHEMRAELIEERNLTELFGNDILPMREV